MSADDYINEFAEDDGPEDGPPDSDHPATLDAEIDARADSYVPGMYGERSTTETRVSVARVGAPSFVCRRPARGAAPGLAGREPTRNELGAQERLLLAALLEEELRPDQRSAFTDMRAAIDLQFGQYPSLTPRQRSWVLSECEERGIDLLTPAERNANVPRGREVAPAWKQEALPLAPPGRKVSAGVAREVVREAMPDVSPLVQMGAALDLQRTRLELERTTDGYVNNCALRNGEDEEDCQICGKACPDKARLLRELAALKKGDALPVGVVRAAVEELRAAAIKPDADGKIRVPLAAPTREEGILSLEGTVLFVAGALPRASPEEKAFRAGVVAEVRKVALRDRRAVRILDHRGVELGAVDSRGMYHPPAEAPAVSPARRRSFKRTVPGEDTDPQDPTRRTPR